MADYFLPLSRDCASGHFQSEQSNNCIKLCIFPSSEKGCSPNLPIREPSGCPIVYVTTLKNIEVRGSMCSEWLGHVQADQATDCSTMGMAHYRVPSKNGPPARACAHAHHGPRD